MRLITTCVQPAVWFTFWPFSSTKMLPLLLLLVLFPLPVAAQNCNGIPPTFWCADEKIISTCGFDDVCGRYQKTTHNEKVNLTILVEALCPDCQNFISTQLYPVVFKHFNDFVNVQLVPFGNAKVQADGTIKCQHGDQECYINKFESCLMDALQNQTLIIPTIYCIESRLQKKEEFADAAQACFDEQKISFDVQRMTQSCLVSKIGTDLQLAAAKQTDNVWPDKHTFVPWIIFNGVSLNKAQILQNEIPSLICQWYNGDKPIPYCETALKKKYKLANKRVFDDFLIYF